jgi:RimJ/RimL family protein N-acetyltransferase
MKAPERIETARLVLARPRAGDAASIFERYASDPEVTKFLGWPRHRTIADTEAFLAFSDAEWDRWPAGPYLIRSRSGDQLLGGTGFAFEAPDRAVTGYVLAMDAWGKGHATEALQAVVDVAPRIGVVRLQALCHPQHRPSRRVLEKCGFTLDDGWTQQAEFPNLAAGVAQPVLCYQLFLEATGGRSGANLAQP